MNTTANQTADFKLYRCSGPHLRIYLHNGEPLLFKDGWFRTEDSEEIAYMDRELRRNGFGPAVWAASKEEYAEYASYVDPTTRRASDIIAQLTTNPQLALQLAEALDNLKPEDANALSSTLAAGAMQKLSRQITVGGKQHNLGGIGSSQTIATVANGSSVGEPTQEQVAPVVKK